MSVSVSFPYESSEWPGGVTISCKEEDGKFGPYIRGRSRTFYYEPGYEEGVAPPSTVRRSMVEVNRLDPMARFLPPEPCPVGGWDRQIEMAEQQVAASAESEAMAGALRTNRATIGEVDALIGLLNLYK